mgnify:CR=1 FL=1
MIKIIKNYGNKNTVMLYNYVFIALIFNNLYMFVLTFKHEWVVLYTTFTILPNTVKVYK